MDEKKPETAWVQVSRRGHKTEVWRVPVDRLEAFIRERSATLKLHQCDSCGFFSTNLDAMAKHAVSYHNWPEDLGDLVPPVKSSVRTDGKKGKEWQ